MHPKGNIWLAVGKRSVGKTHTAMEMAYEFYLKPNVPKSILVFDHSNNSSYDPYQLMPLTIADLSKIPWRMQRIAGIVRSDDIEEFSHAVTNYVKRCTVLFDDCGVLFRANLTKKQGKMLKSPKNNANEMIFQAHSFREISPELLESSNMYIIKETVDDYEQLPQKLISRREISYLLVEVIKENFERPSNQKWATRIFDLEDYDVWMQNPEGVYEIIPGADVFPFSAKNRLLLNR